MFTRSSIRRTLAAFVTIAALLGAGGSASALSTSESANWEAELAPRIDGNAGGTIVYLNHDEGQFGTQTAQRKTRLTIVAPDGTQRQVDFPTPNIIDAKVTIGSTGIITVAWQDQVHQGNTTGIYYRAYRSNGTAVGKTVHFKPPKGIRASRANLTALDAGGNRTILVWSDGNSTWASIRTGTGAFKAPHKLMSTRNSVEDQEGDGLQALPNGGAMVGDYGATHVWKLARGKTTWRKTRTKLQSTPIGIGPFGAADDGSWMMAGNAGKGITLVINSGRSTATTAGAGDDGLPVALPGGAGAWVYGKPEVNDTTGTYPTEIDVAVARPGAPVTVVRAQGDLVVPANKYAGEPYDAESASDGTVAVLTRYTDSVIHLDVFHPDGSITGSELGTEDRGFPSKHWQLIRAGGKVYVVAVDEDHDTGFGTATFTAVP